MMKTPARLKNITLGLLWLSISCSGLVVAGDKISYHSRYGFALSYFNVNENTPNAMVVGEGAPALGIFYAASISQYALFNFGLDVVFIEDKSPFSQRVKNSITDDISDKNSRILGISPYLELGGHYGFFEKKRLVVGLLAGYRFNKVQRSIARCRNCPRQELDDFKNSAYFKPFIGYHFTDHFGIVFSYSNYIKEEGFNNSYALAFEWR